MQLRHWSEGTVGTRDKETGEIVSWRYIEVYHQPAWQVFKGWFFHKFICMNEPHWFARLTWPWIDCKCYDMLIAKRTDILTFEQTGPDSEEWHLRRSQRT